MAVYSCRRIDSLFAVKCLRLAVDDRAAFLDDDLSGKVETCQMTDMTEKSPQSPPWRFSVAPMMECGCSREMTLIL
jgi:hypothetical protein